MPAARHREEVLNVLLAELLTTYGLDATPESVQRTAGAKAVALPDVLVRYRGMRLVLEGKYADSPRAEQVVARQAQDRIDAGVAQFALAVEYPSELRTVGFTRLRASLGSTNLRFSVFSEIGPGRWRDGGLADVLDEVRRVHESMCEGDVVQRAAESIKGYLDGVARLFQENPAICEEMADVLGVGRGGKETAGTKAARHLTVASVAALTLANAFIFQEQLAASGVPHVSSLRETLRHRDVIQKTIAHWDWICENINYVPIFRLASDILAKIPGGSAPEGAIRALAEKALEVCANRAALRHDLMGRIYHYLLHEAKYLGTFYTSVPAATLLLKLALDPARWNNADFSDEKAIARLRVVDLTCGTGTLLMAACQSIAGNFIESSVKAGKKLTAARLGKVHGALMERVMHGYDVLPSAIHLTASTLSLLAPEVMFKKLHLYSMPLSAQRGTSLLGSLEFMERGRSRTQLSLLEDETADTEARAVTGKGYVGATAEVPETDLFVMNPPFVRSVGGNLLFGNLPEEKREVMQEALKARVKANQLKASITAGLGSVFVAVADKYIKEGGRLAFVLPAALATGVAWEDTRDLIQSRYHLEYVVISHDANQWNFSENTAISELMFVCRRLRAGEANDSLETVFINLWRNPGNVGDALAIARLIHSVQPARILTAPSGVANLTELGRKYGEVISVPMSAIRSGWWPTAFAQTELTRIAFTLRTGKLTLPGMTRQWRVPVVPLGQIAELGPDRRDIHDGFEPVDYPTPYKAFWNHDAENTLTVREAPNKYLSARAVAAPGRPLRQASSLWPKAGALLLCERLRINSQRLSSICTGEPVLTNTWWPVTFRSPDLRKDKALALWQNSSPGLAVLFLARIATEGAWVQFKKPSYLSLPVLDVTRLTDAQLNSLAAAFDAVGDQRLGSFAGMGSDLIRRDIDAALSAALNLPDLTPLRAMLGSEPVVTNRPLLAEDAEATQTTSQLDLLFV